MERLSAVSCQVHSRPGDKRRPFASTHQQRGGARPVRQQAQTGSKLSEFFGTLRTSLQAGIDADQFEPQELLKELTDTSQLGSRGELFFAGMLPPLHAPLPSTNRNLEYVSLADRAERPLPTGVYSLPDVPRSACSVQIASRKQCFMTQLMQANCC